MNYNQLATSKNSFQGGAKRVLCCCSAGLLRSPTTAWVLSQEPFDFNTRSCGINLEYALIPITDALIYWADEIVVMSEEQVKEVQVHIYNKTSGLDATLANAWIKPIHNLNIPDKYAFKDAELIKLLDEKLRACFL